MSDASTYDWSNVDPESSLLDDKRVLCGYPPSSVSPEELRAIERRLDAYAHLQAKEKALQDELTNAAIAAADRSGIGSDRVWELAREIKKLRAKA